LPDAPRPDAAPIPVDAAVVIAVDAAVAVTPVVATGRIRGRVLRKGTTTTYPEVTVQLAGLDDPSISRSVTTGPAKKGAYALENLPAGAYRLYIFDEQSGRDGATEVVVRTGQLVKLDLDLTQIPMRRRPPKPYGAPPARRRIV
jgi:Carboxypeptidase regulatory-like domain